MRKILGIFLIAFIWRIWNLSSESLWLDEASTISNIYGNILINSNFATILNTPYEPALAENCTVIVSYMKIHEPVHMPLYFCILNKFIKLIGGNINELTLRIPSLVFSMFGLVALFLTSRKWFPENKEAAMFSLLLATFSPYLIYYSSEARPYALLFMFASFALYFYASLQEKPKATLSNLVFFFGLYMSLCLGLLTHIFFLVFICALAIDWLTSLRKGFEKQYYIIWLAFGVFLGISVFVIYKLFVFSSSSLNFSAAVSKLKLSFLLKSLFSGFIHFVLAVKIPWPLYIALIPIVFLFAKFYSIKQISFYYKKFFSLLILFPLLMMLFAYIFSDRTFVNNRYLIFCSTPIFLLLGLSLSYCGEITKKSLLTCILVFYSGTIIYTKLFPQKQNWKAVASFLNSSNLQNIYVVPTSDYLLLPLNYYWRKPLNEVFQVPVNAQKVVSISETQVVPSWVASTYTETKHQNYNGIHVRTYVNLSKTPLKAL